MTLCETPSVLMNLLRSRCVVAVVKCLKVLATCRKYGMGVSLVVDRTGEWIYLSLSLRDRFLFMFMLRNTAATGRKMVPCSRRKWHYPQVGMKGKRLFGNDPTVFQTCVLGLPGQVNKFDSNHLLPTVWDCLISLPHRVIRATLLLLILMFA